MLYEDDIVKLWPGYEKKRALILVALDHLVVICLY